MKRKTKLGLLGFMLEVLLSLLIGPNLIHGEEDQAVYLKDLTFLKAADDEMANEQFVRQEIGEVNSQANRSHPLNNNGESNFLKPGTKLYLYAPDNISAEGAGFYGAVYRDRQGLHLLSCISSKENTRQFYHLYGKYLHVSYQDFVVTSLQEGQGRIRQH
ncbi:hypothetical protein ACFQHW_07225 [Lapidilactobacillus achengensis]|uniref:Uncharacterized protein n=1 Tax=Lapidilactobacillus achengensis TaxID=2486000 RepID=A0ABW1UN14_9LACO|nr:hypothetical protein [Lapidilactobacillus achengensis]